MIDTIASGIGTPSGLALVPIARSDILFSTFDDTHGSSVLRFNDNTQLPVPGGVATGVGGLGYAEGLAVAQDGSYYVSSMASGQVLHFGNSGVFLGALGAGDANPAPLEEPGTLAFGPNGNLYVADLGAKAIFQFDTSSATQQYLASSTLALGFTPGGMAFAPDSTQDLIVGDFDAQSVVRFHNGSSSTLIGPGSGINPAAILSEVNGNLLIADMDLGNEPSGHHQIVQYDAATATTSQFIDLTTPVGTGTSAGLPPQPTSLMFDTDGNLLVGLSPDHNGDGAVEKFNVRTGSLIGTIAAGIGTPSGLALAPSEVSDLLVGTFDSTGGNGVLRYSAAAQSLAGGCVATGDHALGETEGVAVAPDGSFYVSSLASGQVLHYNNAGVFLNVLGANDADPAPIYAPGTLAFGPNGNLYVADLGSDAIFQFDTTSSTQQYLAADTLSLGFTPGGFAFSADATRDLIVGDLNDQSVLRFHDGSSTALIGPGSGINPASILPLSNGNLLIADLDLGNDPSGHHQIVEYDAVNADDKPVH